MPVDHHVPEELQVDLGILALPAQGVLPRIADLAANGENRILPEPLVPLELLAERGELLHPVFRRGGHDQDLPAETDFHDLRRVPVDAAISDRVSFADVADILRIRIAVVVAIRYAAAHAVSIFTRSCALVLVRHKPLALVVDAAIPHADAELAVARSAASDSAIVVEVAGLAVRDRVVIALPGQAAMVEGARIAVVAMLVLGALDATGFGHVAFRARQALLTFATQNVDGLMLADAGQRVTGVLGTVDLVVALDLGALVFRGGRIFLLGLLGRDAGEGAEALGRVRGHGGRRRNWHLVGTSREDEGQDQGSADARVHWKLHGSVVHASDSRSTGALENECNKER